MNPMAVCCMYQRLGILFASYPQSLGLCSVLIRSYYLQMKPMNVSGTNAVDHLHQHEVVVGLNHYNSTTTDTTTAEG